MQDNYPTGILSSTEIKKAVSSGSILCSPFDELNVNRASLDVSLGYYFYRVERNNEQVVYNPFDRDDVNRYFDGPYKAINHDQWCKISGIKLLKNIPPQHPVIPLKPGERVVAHTHEFIGVKPTLAFDIRLKSNLARNGIIISFDHNFVDSGPISRLSLGIYNSNRYKTSVIPVGETIAQIVFHHTAPSKHDYSSNYNQDSDIETVIKTWSPDLILPKAYQDKRSMPVKIEGITYE